MSEAIKILIVEDEMILATDLSDHLVGLGFDVVSILDSGEDAIEYIKNEVVDIVLFDIELAGELDGIEAVNVVKEINDVPVIFLTSNSDETTFERAKKCNPHAFLSKPFNELDLSRTIELAIQRINNAETENGLKEGLLVPFVLSDCIFVKNAESMVKIVIHDILFIKAERSYCRIKTKMKDHILSMPLKSVEARLPGNHFMRVHRSFILNLAHIDEVGAVHAMVGGKSIPLGKVQRAELTKRLNMI